MSISAAQIVSGQNEINRMHTEVKMTVGMLVGMVREEDTKQFRELMFGCKDNTLTFWRVDETVRGIEVRCFARERPASAFLYAWTTNVELDPEFDEVMDSVAGIKFAHGDLDTFVQGMVEAYPGLREKLESIQAAAAI